MFTLVACLFFIIVLLLVNIGLINKKTSQEKELKEISKAYEINEQNMEDEYAKVAEENEYLTASQIKELIQQAKLDTYPVGSIYISTSSQNPSEYIGGTWERCAQGKTLIGEGTGTDSNNTQKIFRIDEQGGEYTHTLTIAEMPNHNHVNSGYYAPERFSSPRKADYGQGGAFVTGDAEEIKSAGGNQQHNNIQPYIVTYMWKRTK